MSLGFDGPGHRIGEERSRGPVFCRVGKDAHAVEADLCQKVQEGLEFGFSFSRIAYNERRAQGHVGHGSAQIGHQLPRPIQVGWPFHAAQDIRMSMLEREIEVMAHARIAGHDLDQARADVAWIGIHQPQPVQRWNRVQDRPDEAGQSIPLAAITAIGRRILGDQDDLFDILVDQFDGILHDRLQGPAGGGSLDKRDGTKGTGRTATICDLEVC